MAAHNWSPWEPRWEGITGVIPGALGATSQGPILSELLPSQAAWVAKQGCRMVILTHEH
jgi:hypothetical protein